MLVLTRKVGQKIFLGTVEDRKQITIELRAIRNGRASIAIDAPKDVLILREEVEDKLEK